MEGCKSDDYKQSRIVPLSLDEFRVLMEQIYKKYIKDWNTHYEGKKTHFTLPDYKNKRDKDRFHNYKKKKEGFIDNESLGFFMLKNECIKDCCRYYFRKEEFTRKNLYDNYQKYERAIKEKKLDTKIELGKGYSFIFFHYINIGSYTEFKERFKAAIDRKLVTEPVSEGKLIHDVSAISERDAYYFVGLRISRKRVVESKFYIDFEKGDVYMETEGEASFTGGKARYKFPYLEIQFDRDSIQGDIWMPFTAYFEVRENFRELPFILGIANGVSYKTQRSVAGNYALVKEKHYAECSEKIHRHLFQQDHGLEVYVSSVAQSTTDVKDNLSYIGLHNSILENFVGIHELYNIGRTKDEFLRSYKFEIRSDFYGHITSSYQGYTYKARFRVAGAIIIAEIAQINNNTESNRYSVLSNMIVIDTETSLDIGPYRAYGAMCVGASRYYKMEGFPMLLLIKPKDPKPKRINKKDIGEFLNAEKYNKEIMKTLLDLERKRINVVEEMFEGIDLESKSNT